MRKRVRILVVSAVLFLVGAGCGDSADGDSDGPTEPGDGTTIQAPPGDGEGDADSGDPTEPGSSDGSGSGDFETVFGLPPGMSVETDWAPYTRNETEFGVDESVVFEVTGATVDEIIAHYQDSVPAMGYTVDAPLELGDSIALNISDPANPAVTAVIQVGETDGVITVNQNKSTPSDSGTVSTTASTGGSATGGTTGTWRVTEGQSVTVDWSALPSTPYFALTNPNADPYFHIHTTPETDGFFLSFELYTEWGQAWTGQTGTFEISCVDPVTSTGICPYYDPDGPGPDPVLGSDFATTGTVTIDQLDEGGYSLFVEGLTFSDGTTFTPFTMVG